MLDGSLPKMPHPVNQPKLCLLQTKKNVNKNVQKLIELLNHLFNNLLLLLMAFSIHSDRLVCFRYIDSFHCSKVLLATKLITFSPSI